MHNKILRKWLKMDDTAYFYSIQYGSMLNAKYTSKTVFAQIISKRDFGRHC